MAHSFTQLFRNINALWAKFVPYLYKYCYYFCVPTLFMIGKCFYCLETLEMSLKWFSTLGFELFAVFSSGPSTFTCFFAFSLPLFRFRSLSPPGLSRKFDSAGEFGFVVCIRRRARKKEAWDDILSAGPSFIPMNSISASLVINRKDFTSIS